ncbi:MAG: serine/threonine protein kinase, partial [bacterium]
PVYASPETFDARVSRFSDQYSLAIVYQEMLTGKRPFNGTNARMLLMQHVKLPPDLTPLPANERAIVERALAKDPNQRWPTCTAFVQELRALPAVADAAPVLPAAPSGSPPPVVGQPGAPTEPFVPKTRNSAADLPPVDTPEYTPSAIANDQRIDEDLEADDRTESPDEEPATETPSRASDDYSSKRTFIRPPPKPADSETKKPPRLQPVEDETAERRAASRTVQLRRLPVSAKPSPCPRCGGPLSDPDTLAWCPKCGYFATQEKGVAKPGSAKGAAAVLQLIDRWQWIMIGGMAVIAGITFAAGMFLPERSRLRAMWSLTELGLAILGLGVAHVWAMRLACWFADGKLALGEVL